MAPSWSICRVCKREFRGNGPADTICRRRDEAHDRARSEQRK